MRRFSIEIVGTVCIVIAGSLLVFKYLPEANTQYGSGFLKAKFHKVQVGASVREVYQYIGPPLFIYLNTNRAEHGSYRMITETNVGFDHVYRLLLDSNKEVYMNYSVAKDPTKDFFLYALDVREMRVFRKIEAARMD